MRVRLTDVELRGLHQYATASTDRASCPTAAALASLARGDLSAAERARMIEHLAACSSCALETRLALEVEPWSDELGRGLEEGRLGEGVAEAGRAERGRTEAARRWGSWASGRQLALAATILVALAAGIWLARVGLAPGEQPGDEVLRGEEAAVVPRSGSDLDAPPERLQWSPQPGATGYRVVFYDARASRLWESPQLETPQLVLPPEARARLQPDGSYLWLVEVAGPAPRRELGPYRFRLARSR